MVLSIICVGLWAGIAWFIREIEAIKQAEQLEKEKNGNVEGEVEEEKKDK